NLYYRDPLYSMYWGEDSRNPNGANIGRMINTGFLSSPKVLACPGEDPQAVAAHEGVSYNFNPHWAYRKGYPGDSKKLVTWYKTITDIPPEQVLACDLIPNTSVGQTNHNEPDGMT